MQLNYKIEHRNIKYPRLEFKGTTLLVILPPNIKDPTKIIEKRKKLDTKEMANNTESNKEHRHQSKLHDSGATLQHTTY